VVFTTATSPIFWNFGKSCRRKGRFAQLGEEQQLIDKLSHQLALFCPYLYGRRSEQPIPSSSFWSSLPG